MDDGRGLELQAVEFHYDDLHMSFDLSAPAGQCTAIIGPSGAGKSTLLSLIAGFDGPKSGRILFNGEDITKLPPARRPVTTLFQEHNLFHHLTVWQNVGLGLHPGLRLDDEQKSALRGALAQVGLDGLAERLPGQLSGGQRQRVALARSLVRRRPLLLLDEPFSALDPGLRREMLDLLDNLRKDQNLTVLMVSHDPRDAERIAAHCALLSQGRVIAMDRTETLLGNHDIPELNAFLGRS